MYEAFIAAFIALFVIIDPIGIAPVFAGLTQGTPKSHKRSMAIKGSIVGTLILVFFALVGEAFLGALGISMDALRVAGGVMLFIIAIEMVFEKRTERKQDAAERIDEHFEDISVFPIGLPLLAGPGSIATIMLLIANHNGDYVGQAGVLAALGLVMLITLLTFLVAGKVMDFLGPTVNAVLTRLLGVILAALAFQYILDGLKATFLGG
ncbi:MULTISPECIES: MarC family protein [Kordiimonas]|uniref:MarC family protein n=1 Tax=Kordiimonas TaxID=288021 RepID=UPI001FF44381|nr:MULTISPECIES: MarC family protein [Kordiimonas]MCK0069968.1 MarC family protein [Kordiimonas laminariae]UTW59270.1 MarC family protein [Kordiimonas sp. SCSIO 12603]